VSAHPEPAASRRRVPALLIESALIVLSVLLGFAATAWHDRQQERALAADALQGFRREISQNLATLERMQPIHVAMSRRLAAEAAEARPNETAFDAFKRSLPDSGAAVPPLSDAAWDIAATTGALRLLGFERAARLSETYQVQRTTLLQTVARLEDRLNVPEMFEPARRAAMLRVHALLYKEIEGEERYLIDVYRATLPRLDPGGR
jgi:hypothetical protein